MFDPLIQLSTTRLIPAKELVVDQFKGVVTAGAGRRNLDLHVAFSIQYKYYTVLGSVDQANIFNALCPKIQLDQGLLYY